MHSSTLCEQWLAVAQTGTVAEFRRKFIEMAAPLEKIPESILMGHFVNGLKEDIRAEVRMLGLHNLEQEMDLALKVEEKIRAQSSKLGEGKTQYSTSFKLGPNSQFSLYSKKSDTNVVSPSSLSSKSGSTTFSGPWSRYVVSPKSQGGLSQYSSSIPVAKPVGEIRRLTEK